MTASPPALPLSDPSTTASFSDPLEPSRVIEPNAESRKGIEHAPPVDPSSLDIQTQRDGSTDTIEGAGGKKKRRRPGWKGWALVVEDEQGNVLEYRPRGESPENEASREGSAVIDNGRKAKSMSPFVARQAGASTSPLVRSQALEKSISSDGQAKKRRRDSSTGEGPSNKSPRVQTIPLDQPTASPSTAAAPTPPSAIPPRIISGEHSKPSSSRSRVRTTSPSRAGTSQAREDARVAREARTEARSRVSTPISAIVLPDDNPLPRVPRVGMGEDHPRPQESDVRAEGAYLIEAANRRREEESLREEECARDEDKMRLLAEQRLHEEKLRAQERSERGSYPQDDELDRRSSITGWQPRDEPNGDPRAAPRRFWKGQNGSSNHRPDPAYSRPSTSDSNVLPVSYQSSNGQPARSRYSAVFDIPPPSLPPQPPVYANHRQTASQDDFDTQYAAIQDDFARRASTSSAVPLPEGPPMLVQEVALGRGAEDAKPPRFHPGQRPTVVIAPIAPSGRRPRDRIEREHNDGFDGLTHDVMADCDGFVDNVRDNLRNIVTYFLPQPSDRRDAFLERVGRGLVELGWQLTDTGDGALQRSLPAQALHGQPGLPGPPGT